MTLGTTLLSLVRSRVVAQLERCSCPILHAVVPKFRFFALKKLKKNLGSIFFGIEVFRFLPKLFREKPYLSVKNLNNLFVKNDP